MTLGLAPEPGQRSRAEANAEARKAVVRITLKGRTLEVYPAIGPADDRLARRVLGGPISPMLNAGYVFGADSLMDLWWFARVKNGEPGLTLDAVLAEFPTLIDIAEADPDVTFSTPDEVDGHPEA